MTLNSSNDNGLSGNPAPDAYGHAALLLVESVLHGLIEQSVFTVAKAVELVDLAAEVTGEIGFERGDSPATLMRSLTLLDAISASLRNDIEA